MIIDNLLSVAFKNGKLKEDNNLALVAIEDKASIFSPLGNSTYTGLKVGNALFPMGSGALLPYWMWTLYGALTTRPLPYRRIDASFLTVLSWPTFWMYFEGEEFFHKQQDGFRRRLISEHVILDIVKKLQYDIGLAWVILVVFEDFAITFYCVFCSVVMSLLIGSGFSSSQLCWWQFLSRVYRDWRCDFLKGVGIQPFILSLQSVVLWSYPVNAGALRIWSIIHLYSRTSLEYWAVGNGVVLDSSKIVFALGLPWLLPESTVLPLLKWGNPGTFYLLIFGLMRT